MEPILAILPGLICDSRMFGAQLSEFPGSIVVDGLYGGSDSIGAMADFALARLPTRVNLLGHSMGARVALELCRKAPERVVRLALADTGVHPVREGERAARYALRDIGRGQGMTALVDAWLPPMLGKAAQGNADLVMRLRAMCIDAGLATFEAQTAALLARPDVGSNLGEMACPTHLVVGREDSWATPAQHEEMARVIPNAKLHIVEGAGHMLPFEAPDAFNAVIREWLAVPATPRVKSSA